MIPQLPQLGQSYGINGLLAENMAVSWAQNAAGSQLSGRLRASLAQRAAAHSLGNSSRRTVGWQAPAGLCASPATHQEGFVKNTVVEHAQDGGPAAHTPAILAPAHAVVCLILHREHHHAQQLAALAG